MAKTSPRINKQHGFTLIELIVVITVLALLASAIMPNLANQKQSREIRQFFPAARSLMSDARERAISDGVARRVRYEESGPRLVVERVLSGDSEGGETEERSLSLPSGVTASAFRFEKEDSTSGEWYVGFYPDGKSEGGAIQFDANGAAETIEIDHGGAIRVTREALPDLSEEEWDAGGYEQRI